MLRNFKVTSYVFILCLFGFTLITVSPVIADDSIDFVECQQIKPNRTSYALMKEKKNCFRDLARESLGPIALVNIEIEESIVRLQETEPAYQVITGLDKFSKTDLGIKLEDIGNVVSAPDEAIVDLATGVSTSIAKAGEWVDNIFFRSGWLGIKK